MHNCGYIYTKTYVIAYILMWKPPTARRYAAVVDDIPLLLISIENSTQILHIELSKY